MKIHVLASGSSGNSYCIQTDTDLIFIDIGVTLASVKSFLATLEDTDGYKISLFITHEHSDHINGIVAFVRRYSPNIYTSNLTAHYLRQEKGISEALLFPLKPDCYYEFETFAATAFDVSHDAAQPFGFIIMLAEGNIGFLTDLGCVTDKQRKHLEAVDMLVLETNHDRQMLKKGNYPLYLKRRIASHLGHLSNEDAINLISSLQPGNLKACLFAHISEENNDYSMLEELSNFCINQYKIKANVLRQKEYNCFDLATMLS